MAKELPILSVVRKQLMSSGQSEHELLADEGPIRAMFEQLQDLKMEMNEAKKAAAEEAAKPYLEAMEKIQKRYAMLAKLSAQ